MKWSNRENSGPIEVNNNPAPFGSSPKPKAKDAKELLEDLYRDVMDAIDGGATELARLHSQDSIKETAKFLGK